MVKYRLDPKNARIHPVRNRDAIGKSLRELGAGRSIVVDKDWRQEARELHRRGINHQAISKRIGIPASTVYLELNPNAVAKARIRTREWCRANPEKHNEHTRQWREANPEKEAARHKKYREKHREELVIRNQEWRMNHPEEKAAHDLKYRQNHKDQICENSARRRAQKRAATTGDLAAIKKVYRQSRENKNVKCYYCGLFVPKGERHVDHVVPLAKGGQHTASNLVISCVDCNLAKGVKMPDEVGVLI